MKLIVGLGNPGEKYQNTRHNFGFLVVDQFLKHYAPLLETAWDSDNKLKSNLAVIDWKPKIGELERVILAKPQTYMNNSGLAVSLIGSYYKIAPEDIWVVYDELDLPLGTMKIRLGGAAAGHHGVESIMEKLGTDKFWRFRMGIGSTHQSGRQMRDSGKERTISKQNFTNTEEYVLGSFTGSDRGKLRTLLKHGSQALELALEKGLDAAMNRYNT